MFQNLAIFQTAAGLSHHAARSQAQIATNIANADTPGYRARDVGSFADSYRSGGSGLRATRAGHLMSAGVETARLHDRPNEASPNGNTVSLEQEMVASVSAQQDHDRALAIYRFGLNLMRAPLGRR